MSATLTYSRPLLLPVRKQIGHGDATVDYGTEKPKYRALRRAVNDYYRDIRRPLMKLRATSLQAVRREPAKAFSFSYTDITFETIEAAVDIFLRSMAGPVRTREGFVNGGPESETPDGVIQQRNTFTHAIGLKRGADLLSRPITVAASRSSPAVRAMLDRAFDRLSEGGKLRLEGVRDEIHSILTSAQDAGLSPLETARILSKQFDEYNRVEFQRLARTEAAFAAEEGSRNQMAELGVTHVRWVISAGACSICQSFVGRDIPIGNTDEQPPQHPNCLCSTVPAEARFF